MGGSKRAYVRILNFRSDVVICYKQRKEANIIDTMELIGEVKGKM
jgi:ribose-phosphate pyrophosphokinase